MPQSQNTQMLTPQVRAAQIEPSSYNPAKRTVDVTFTTGAMVRRYDWVRNTYYDEQLVVSPDAIDLTRLNAGASVLNTHGQYQLEDVLGVVERAWVEGETGAATVRLSEREQVAGLVQDIAGGILRHISVGYSVQRYLIVPTESRTDGGTVPIYRAERWTPHEISFVPVPADAGSGTRSQPSQGQYPCEFITRAAAHSNQQELTSMPQAQTGGQPTDPAITTTTVTQTRAEPALAPAAVAAPAAQPDTSLARAAEISELCARHGVPGLAANLIRSNADVGAAQAAILDQLARADSAAGGHRNSAPRIQTIQDQMQVRMAGIEQAIIHRLAPATALDENARQYRGLSLLEIGRDFLEAHSVNTRGMDKMTLAGQVLTYRSAGALGTSDFASLFANVASKRLRNAYDENPGTYQMWARRAPNAPDFKNMSVVQMSGAPDLLKVNEAGEFTYGSLKDAEASYSVITYGRIVSLTRQAIINDDLRAFDRLATAFGFAARRLENRLVYAQLTASTNYSTQLGNLATGGGSVLSLDSLKAMRAAMRLQKGLAGEELNLAPSFLIVPAALEQPAYQFTSSNYMPAKPSDVNEFRTGGRTALEPVVEPILDAQSATAWYATANSGAVDTVEFCYLDGNEGPMVESKPGWEVDGVEYKCRLDFAAKAIDTRGLYKGAGA